MCQGLNYTALSIQMAGQSSKSICQLAIRVVQNGDMVFCKAYLIKPPDGLKFTFEDYHGISERKVKDKPTLDKIWPEIEQHLKGKNVLVYWIEKSKKWLESSLAVYKIPAPECNYIDILDLLNENREYFSFKAIAKSIDFDDDFQTGDSLNNVRLYGAIIGNLIERRSKKFQEAFKVNLQPQKRVVKVTNHSSCKNVSKTSTGCLLPVLLAVIATAFLFAFY